MAEVKAGSPQDERWPNLVTALTPQKKKKKLRSKPAAVNTEILEREIEALSLENEQLRKKYTAENQKCNEHEANLKMFNEKIDRLQKQAAAKPTVSKPKVQRRIPTSGRQSSANA